MIINFMNLIIVESPTKSRTLSGFLGKDYKVEATYGHIKDLPKSKLGVDTEKNFKPDYVVVEKRNKEIKNIVSQAKKAKKVYLASDPDREGEAIASHVAEIISDHRPPTTIHRIVFHEITKDAVEEALANPRIVNNDLVDAQTARRVLDRLVGYSLSPLLWKKVRRGLSAGRVQSVAVRLIVEREKEIEAFKPVEYWEVVVTLKKHADKLKFDANLIKTKIDNKKQADEVVADLKKADYIVDSVVKRQVKKSAYPPYTTSTMTQAAARIMNWSSRKTMAIAQGLYEQGLITYHRTDSTNIASSALAKARSFIENKYGKSYLPDQPNFFKRKSKSAQEAHEAIRPTDPSNMKPEFKDTSFAADMKKLYGLIWKRFIACQMTPAVYDETRIDVKSTPEVYVLRASGQIMNFDGWKVLYKAVDGSQSAEIQILPEVEKGEKLDFMDLKADQKFTQPPPRYNEASLIKTLEKLGIGRPSTYAPTITTIQTRSYVEKDEGKFTPTPVGVAVNDFLVKNFPKVFDYDFTAGMEESLDKVASGEVKWAGVIKDFWPGFAKKLTQVEEKSKRVKIETEKLGKKCPKCKIGELVVRTGRFGKFISCSRFPDCDYKEKYLEKIHMKCPECKKGEVVIKQTGKRRKFFGCSRYPDCKFASWTNPKQSDKKVDADRA